MIKTRLPNIEELDHIGSASATDAAFVLGALQAISSHDGRYQTWLASASTDKYGLIKTLSGYGHVGKAGADDIQCYGIRPIMKKLPTIQSVGTKAHFLELDGQKIDLEPDQMGRLSFEYGAYPTEVVTDDLNRRLEEERKKGTLNPTRHFYTTDGSAWSIDSDGFVPYQNPEYEFEGERYVRLKVQNSEMFYVATGEMICGRPVCWVKIKPIRWIYDTQRSLVYTEQAVLSGLRWNEKEGNKRYDKSLIARYLRDVFDPEMMQSHDFFYAKHMARHMDSAVASRVVELLTQGKSRAEQRQMLPQFNERERQEAIQQLVTPSPERTIKANQGFELHHKREQAIIQEKQAQEELAKVDETATPAEMKNAKRRVARAQQRVEQQQALCQKYLNRIRS